MYLIDGYNLLHALRSLTGNMPRDFAAARRRVMDLLQALAVNEGQPITVYFDGTPGRGGAPDLGRRDVRLVFVGGDADEALRKAVREDGNPERLTVVSSDKEIMGPCRAEGAACITSESFVSRLNRLAVPYAESGIAREVKSVRPTNSDFTPHDALPNKRGAHDASIRDIEREMLEEVGDMEELVRDAISEPSPRLRHDDERALDIWLKAFGQE